MLLSLGPTCALGALNAIAPLGAQAAFAPGVPWIGGVAMVAALGTWTAAAAWPLLGWLLVQHGRRELQDGSWDAIIVPGCRVMPNGRPSTALHRRTTRAVELWHAKRAPRIILTGGVGDSPPAEAVAAAALAQQLGVPMSALVLEDRSTSTEDNARFAAQLSDARRVLVVSDDYHVFRCVRVFRRHFDHADGTGTITAWPGIVRMALREVVVIGIYAVRGRLNGRVSSSTSR